MLQAAQVASGSLVVEGTRIDVPDRVICCDDNAYHDPQA